MRAFLLAAAVLSGVVAAGCDARDRASVPAPDPEELLAGNGLVLDDEQSPTLCLGDVTASKPPLCSGIPLAGWDWSAVEGEEAAGGVTWGSYRVVGTYDGTTFTLAEAGPPGDGEGTAGSDRDFTTPCPEPESGWVDVDPATAGEGGFERGAAAAARLPSYVALWVTYVGDPTPEEMTAMEETGLPQTIMNVVVNADAAGAEAAVREAWGGPLCVVEREVRPDRELRAIRAEAERYLDELGIRWTWSQDGDVGLAAEVGVIADPDGAAQAALDARYGRGMVRLFPALRPVAGSR